MNNQRRKEIAAIVKRLADLATLRDELRDDIDTLISEEQDYLDAMPESLQNGDKGERAQSAVDNLQQAYDALDALDFDEPETFLNDASE
jgi:t-SNARE complex subunit (syntaxin)